MESYIHHLINFLIVLGFNVYWIIRFGRKFYKENLAEETFIMKSVFVVYELLGLIYLYFFIIEII